ncbi:hypothetical protein Tco_0552194 [Tanacetum coccineum]
MLHISPNLPGQKFEDPPFEEEILSFIRDLGYPGDINSLSDVNVDTLYQPWRTFGTIINKCLSGKEIGLNQLRLSRAQIIWGMYHQKNVDYVYLLWEDLLSFIKSEEKFKINSKKEKGWMDHLANNDPILHNEIHPNFWKSSDEDDDDEVSISKDDDDDAENEDDDGQDDDNEQTESDNDGDEFVHPKFSTHYQEESQDEEDKDEEGSNLRVQTPSHFEITDDEAYNEVTQGVNTNVQGTQVTEDTHVIIKLHHEVHLTSLVDVPVTSNVEVPPSSVTTLPPPPIPHIQPQQQTPVSTPTIVPNRLRSEVEAYNEDFFNKIDEIMKKIIKEQVKVQVKEQVSKILPKIKKFVNDQLEVEVLIRSSNEAKTTHAVAANLSELELKKILIDKIENNKSIDRSIQQKTLYKALTQDDEDGRRRNPRWIKGVQEKNEAGKEPDVN